jgi:hypothetical protein
MPQCQFLFSAVFLFHVFTEGNILGIGSNKSQSSYFSDTKTESKGETDTSREAATPCHGAGPPLPRLAMVWAPRASTDLALPPIYCPWCKNPKKGSLHQWKFPQCHHHQRQVLGDRNLCSGTLPGWGIAPESSPSTLLTPMTRRE